MQLIKFEKFKSLFRILIILLLTSPLFAQSIKSNAEQKISIVVEKEDVFWIIDQLKKQTNLEFIYNPKDLNKERQYTLYSDQEELSEVLKMIFIDEEILFKIKDGQVILYKSQKEDSSHNPTLNKAEKITLSGYVTATDSGESLIGATVYEKNTLIATTTNNFGFFSLSLPAMEQTIIISFIGYDPVEIIIKKSQQLAVKLNTASNNLKEIVVTSTLYELDNPIESSRMSTQRLSMEKMNSIPALAGETDILKGISLLPGFKQGADGTSGFYVRGGGPDQNLILLDGVPMYNPFHLWGFLSTFNSDAINNVEVTKGAFPARYGGRLSSVVDITTKDGSNQKWEKNLTFGLLSARINLGGPIKKDKSSMSFSARRTLLDLFITPIAAERAKGFVKKIGYNFGDVNIKFNQKLSDKDRIYLTGFYSRDNFSLNSRQDEDNIGLQRLTSGQGWSNYFGSMRWNHLYSDKLFSNTTLYYSDYKFFTNSSKEFESTDEQITPSTLRESSFSSIINDLALKQDFQYYASPQHTIRFGASAIIHKFTPGVNTLFQQTGKETLSANTPDNSIKANEYDVYIEDDIAIGQRIKINLGIHGAGMSVLDTSYHSIQPRASLNVVLNKNWAIKAGYSQMNQYLHLLNSSSLLKASDLWVPVTKRIKPLKSSQFSLGTVVNMTKDYSLEIEAYYKDMDGLIEYKEGALFLFNANDWEDNVVVGEGNSYGCEIFLQKKKGPLTGWLGYSLSWTNRTFQDINFGQTFPYKYDRRHDISIVGNYQLNKTWSLNMSWVFYSGSYVSLPTSNYINPHYDGSDNYGWFQFPGDGTVIGNISLSSTGVNENTTSRNNYKLADYHRLDLSTSRKKVSKKGRATVLTIGLTNAYNKFNPSFFDTQFSNLDGEGLQTKIFETSLFPIFPTISYSIQF